MRRLGSALVMTVIVIGASSAVAEARKTLVRWPAQAVANETLVVRGALGAAQRQRLRLVSRTGRRWMTVTRSRSNAKGRFTLRWVVPLDRSVLSLRVMRGARKHARTLSSRRYTVAQPNRAGSENNPVVPSAPAEPTSTPATSAPLPSPPPAKPAGGAVIGGGTAGGGPSAPEPPPGGGQPIRRATLLTGESLLPGEALWSSDGRYKAIMQGDGNFVVYDSTDGRALWSTQTGSPGARITMQGDGNLVVYSTGGQALWSSSTAPSAGAVLTMQRDSNLVIYSGSGTALWSSNGGLVNPPTPPPPAAEQVTILSPATGFLSSSPLESPPHHRAYGGDWAVDVASNGGVAAPVYARFANATGALTLSIVGTFEPCAPPNQGAAGQGVKVQVTVDGVRLGTVAYAHLALARTSGTIANGEMLGTMVTGRPRTSCWTGPHVHTEPRNDTSYACFQPTALNAQITTSTALGVLGGRYASGPDRTCPAGATTP